MCTNLLKRYIRAEMVPLILIRDGQCLNALPGYAKIAENRIFLILGKVSAKCYDLLSISKYKRGWDRCGQADRAHNQ